MGALLTPELAIQLAAMVLTAGSIYGAIRAELRMMRTSIDRAHERIDNLLESRR
ncbi:hypothetical protein [Burkholderia ubonensis]|uniref:hypothetical protein n=1 Tax=Burkholderia ubonensis TaxID=101571 RepID=UPI0015A6B307|nr:hypothetical protein [Burkholderia ubonensis]